MNKELEEYVTERLSVVDNVYIPNFMLEPDMPAWCQKHGWGMYIKGDLHFITKSTEIKNNLFLIIDGSNIAYRAYHGNKKQRLSYEGNPTGAIYGFKGMFTKFIKKFNPSHVIVVFDHPSPTFRHRFYPDYKGTRVHDPVISQQWSSIFEFLAIHNIKQLVVPNYEADDVIATLSYKFEEDMPCIIISNDKDLGQIVSEQTFVYDPVGVTWTPQYLKDEKFGVGANQVAAYLALMGDSSDNIPGVEGIGKITAAELLNQFPTLLRIRENTRSLKPKIGLAIENNWETIKLAYSLTKLCFDVPIGFPLLKEFERIPPDLDLLADFYVEHGFKKDF